VRDDREGELEINMLKQRIKEDLNSAVKQNDEIRRSTLRLVLAAVANKEIDKKYKEKLEGDAELTDEEIISVISSEAKKRREAAIEFEKGSRKELAEKELSELEVLKIYLPEQLSEEEISKIVKEAIKKIGALSLKDIGKVMAAIMPQVKGKADGTIVSRIVKELLS
jgi:uncharacterized protein